jgi:Na+/melibiose symporter-like transporter
LRALLNDRQKRTGWLLIVVSAAYLIYFIKVRLFTVGLPIERKEWFYFVAMIAILMLGTLNVRLAAMRERRKADSSKKSA